MKSNVTQYMQKFQTRLEYRSMQAISKT